MPSKGTVSEPTKNVPKATEAFKWEPDAVIGLRTSMRLSQAEFAEMLSVERGTVINWELGKKRVSRLNSAALDDLHARNENKHMLAQREKMRRALEGYETQQPKAESVQHLAGRSIEIEALFAYVTQRQRELSVALQNAALAEEAIAAVRRSAEGQERAAKE